LAKYKFDPESIDPGIRDLIDKIERLRLEKKKDVAKNLKGGNTSMMYQQRADRLNA